MASESGSSDASPLINSLINSINREISLFLPFLLGLNTNSPLPDSENPSQELQNLDRIILINPFTRSMFVIERGDDNGGSGNRGLSLGSFLRDLFLGKDGLPPASKASIEAMSSVEIVGDERDGEECSICLDEWESGVVAKEMPCKHIFHGECIEKWLKIHGSCPVCRCKMPVEEGDELKGKTNEDSDDGRRREIWVSFSASNRESEEIDRSVCNGANDSSSSH